MRIRDFKVLNTLMVLLCAFVLILCSGLIRVNRNSETLNQNSQDANSNNIVTTDNDAQKDETKKREHDLTFAVFADVHDNAPDLQSAIDDFNTIDKNLDALILNGDTVDQGTDSQYETMSNKLEENKDKLPKTILKTIGNHEFYDYDNGRNTPEALKEKINKFLKFAGRDKVYYDEWINDYHFICLGSEDGNSETFNTMSAYISDEQLNFLEEKLKENYKEGRPIFVFLHQPLIVNWGYGDKTEVNYSSKINDILSKYPECVFFNSHTHKELKADSINLTKPYKSIQTGSLSYTLYFKEQKYDRDFSRIYGLYVTVDGNNVKVNGRDITNKKWLFNTGL